jgi:hypothetical protein
MKNALVLATVLLVCVSSLANDRVDKEIARLEETLQTAEAWQVPSDVKELSASIAARWIGRRTPPRPSTSSIACATHSSASRRWRSWRNTTPALDRVNALGAGQKPRFAAKPPEARGSLLQRGLIESANIRAGRLFHASLPYAKAAAPWSGIYYLDEAGSRRCSTVWSATP